MIVKMSAGRHDFLSPTFCKHLSLTADTELEAEFLARIEKEIRDGNIGFWLSNIKLAREQKAKGKQARK